MARGNGPETEVGLAGAKNSQLVSVFRKRAFSTTEQGTYRILDQTQSPNHDYDSDYDYDPPRSVPHCHS